MKRYFLALAALALTTLVVVNSRHVVKPVELGSKWEVTCVDNKTGKVLYHATGVEYPVSNVIRVDHNTTCFGKRLPK